MPHETTDTYTYGWSWGENSPEEWDFDGKWAEIYDLHVFDDSKERQKIGTQIIGDIMRQVREQGGERLYIMMGSASDGSDIFLRKNGFTIQEVTDSDSVIGYIDL